jgi:class 3 adenylate cyclase
VEEKRHPPSQPPVDQTHPSAIVQLSAPDLHATPPGPFTYSNSVMVLLCTDIVGSLDLKSRLGESAAASIIRKHDRLFRRVIDTKEGAEILKDRGDGFIAGFQSASDAISAALLFQYALAHYDLRGERIHVRIGVHLGEVTSRRVNIEHSIKIIGSPIDVTARLCDLAQADQILMSEAIFDNARRYVKRHPRIRGVNELPELRWQAHGEYKFKGFDHTIRVFEVGHPEIAPMKKPPDGAKAEAVLEDSTAMLAGWRPAAGLHIPGRRNWVLRDKLGVGAFGEVWLAHNSTSAEPRAFKFCFDARSLEALSREQQALHQINSRLGQCRHICRIFETQLDRYPYFIESEYCNRGNIYAWSEFFGGVGAIDTHFLVGIASQVAGALADAHGVGITHKDIKPENILLHEDAHGQIEVRLADFGMGEIAPAARTPRADSTASGLSPMRPAFVAADPRGSSSTMYTAPEVLTGGEWGPQSDVYALGILLYQMMAGDFRRPIAPGWERHVEDPVLAQEIATMADTQPERRPSADVVASHLANLDALRAERPAPARVLAGDGHLPAAPSGEPATDGQAGSGILCKCGYVSNVGARFCSKCGSPLSARCMYCGQEGGPADKFCGRCGHRL